LNSNAFYSGSALAASLFPIVMPPLLRFGGSTAHIVDIIQQPVVRLGGASIM
jgi:hypothetical protein